MLKWFDKIWCWHGWTIIKWPFGILLCWFILVQIYNFETIPNYEQSLKTELKENIRTFLHWNKILIKSFIDTISASH